MSHSDQSSELHRIYIHCRTTTEWYAIMRECRLWFGKNWRCQGKVRRHLDRGSGWPDLPGHTVWFEVPDLTICSWIATKLALEVHADEITHTQT